jgi:hypothetical protein
MIIIGLYLTLVLVIIIALFSTIFFIVITINSPFHYSKKISNASTDFKFCNGQNISALTVKNPIPFLKETMQQEMEKLLSQVIQWLNDAEIENWAVRSTMLSAVRHSSLMPWHENITLAVDHKHLSKLVGIRNHIQENKKVLLSRTKDGYRFCANNFARFPFIGIFIATVVDDDVVCCTPLTELGQCTFKDSHLRRREIYNIHDVFPLRSAKLGNISVNVPKNAEKCLDILYGKKWKTEVYNNTFLPYYFNSYTKNLIGRLTFMIK